MRSNNLWVAAIQDLAEGVRLAPLWWRLGVESVITRYRRTVLGPFWIASSTLATGVGLAIVFGGIFGGPWRETFPYFLGSITAWALISGTVLDGANTFLAGAGIMQVKRLPISFHAFLQMQKLVLNFAHQLVAFWVVLLALGLFVLPHWQFVPALVLVIAIGLCLAIPLGMVSTRYRDVGQMIAFVMQALFLLTPVFWRKAQLGPNLRWIVDYNPFAHMLEVLRQPLNGVAAPAGEWAWCLGFLAVCAALSFVSVALFRRRVVFWL